MIPSYNSTQKIIIIKMKRNEMKQMWRTGKTNTNKGREEEEITSGTEFGERRRGDHVWDGVGGGDKEKGTF